MAIVGRPNVGKSSIFNKLLQRERAIVTDIPGTTRDVLSDAISIEGIPVHLIDTAGIRHSIDVVEKIGIERTRSAMADADIILLALDGSEPLTQDDVALLSETRPVPRLIIVNKSDLPGRLSPDHLESFAHGGSPVFVSALTGQGVDLLRTRVVESITTGGSLAFEHVILTNSRHHHLIVRVIESLKEALAALEVGLSEEIVLVGLHDALRRLGEITGETTIDDILDQIFSTFCVGK